MKSSHSDRLLLSPRPAWVALARVFSNLSMDRCRWRCGLRFLIEDPFLLFFLQKLHQFLKYFKNWCNFFSSNPKDSKNSFIHSFIHSTHFRFFSS